MAAIVSAIRDLSAAVGGVFTLADIKAVLGTKHSRTFYLRLKLLEDAGILTRFARGVYVTEGFDPAVLSQVLCPDTCISFEYILAKHLVIGSGPGTRIRAVKIGKKRLYTAPGIAVSIEHLGIKESLFTCFETVKGIKYAIPEKALLDTLYFYVRGYSFNFDIHSDLNLERINPEKLRSCLELYDNPKFITFVKGIVNALS